MQSIKGESHQTSDSKVFSAVENPEEQSFQGSTKEQENQSLDKLSVCVAPDKHRVNLSYNNQLSDKEKPFGTNSYRLDYEKSFDNTLGVSHTVSEQPKSERITP